MNSSSVKRVQLYELVWSEPMQQLAKHFGVSDVALGKNCRQAGIPVPPRGYWAKLQAGKKVSRLPLPEREIGESDTVSVPGRPSPEVKRRLAEILVSSPTGEEDVEVLLERFRRKLGKVAVPRDFSRAHRDIRKYLDKDEVHRQKKATERFYWRDPVFDNSFERRRLRILNVLFVTAARVGGGSWVRGDNAREHTIVIGQTHVSFTLDRPQRRSGRGSSESKDDKLVLAISAYNAPNDVVLTWQDETDAPLEKRMTEIFVGMALYAEKSLRKRQRELEEWERQRQAEAEEAARRQRLEAERKEKERLAAIEQAKINALLSGADALRRAEEIRSYVSAVLARTSSGPDQDDIARWAQWALEQADRIDPVVSGAVLRDIQQWLQPPS